MNRESSRSHSVFTCTIESKVCRYTSLYVSLGVCREVFPKPHDLLESLNLFVSFYAVGIQFSYEHSVWAIKPGGSCRVGEVRFVQFQRQGSVWPWWKNISNTDACAGRKLLGQRENGWGRPLISTSRSPHLGMCCKVCCGGLTCSSYSGLGWISFDVWRLICCAATDSSSWYSWMLRTGSSGTFRIATQNSHIYCRFDK